MGIKRAGSRLATWLFLVCVATIQAANTGPTGVAPAAMSMGKPVMLSVFTNGIGKGAHAVYVHANFDALMNPSGQLLIYPKDKGTRIGKPLTMGVFAHYIGNRQAVERPFVLYGNDTGPLTNPSMIELKGRLMDDVDCNITFAFEKNTISVRGYGQDPAGLKPPTVFRFYIRVPAYTNFPPEMLQPDREARLKGLAFAVRRGQKKMVYPYANGAVFRGMAEKCWIEGPVYETRKLSFDVKSPDTAPMQPVIYPNVPVHNGYVIYMHKRDTASTKPNERLTLTIE